MPVQINGATSGSATLQATDAATVTLTLPSTTGSLGINGPAFSAYQSSAQTLSSATFTKIQFQTEEFDTNSNFDNVTNYRFTPTVAGYYQVSGSLSVAATATNIFFYAYKNGALYKSMGGVGGTVVAASGSALVFLNGSTDYIELYGYFGVGQNTNAGIAYTYFQAAMVRSA